MYEQFSKQFENSFSNQVEQQNLCDQYRKYARIQQKQEQEQQLIFFQEDNYYQQQEIKKDEQQFDFFKNDSKIMQDINYEQQQQNQQNSIPKLQDSFQLNNIMKPENYYPMMNQIKYDQQSETVSKQQSFFNSDETKKDYFFDHMKFLNLQELFKPRGQELTDFVQQMKTNKDFIKYSENFDINFNSNEQKFSTQDLNQNDLSIQNKHKQLSQSFIQFEQFVHIVEQNDPSLIDFQKLRNQYKIEIQEFPNSINQIFYTYKQIFEKYKNRRYFIRKIWWEKELCIFIWIMVKYTQIYEKKLQQFNEEDWYKISSMLPLKSSEECQIKWLALEKVSLQKIPWSFQEDQTLKQIINEKGPQKWADISKQLHERLMQRHFRSSKQCRERWNNYLNPKLKKGDWVINEDVNLLRLAKLRGKRWAQISREMIGRNENTVKNRYNCLIKRAKKDQRFPTLSQQCNFSSESQCDSINSEEMMIVDQVLDLKLKILENRKKNCQVPRVNSISKRIKKFSPNKSELIQDSQFEPFQDYLNKEQVQFRKKLLVLENLDLNNFFTQNAEENNDQSKFNRTNNETDYFKQDINIQQNFNSYECDQNNFDQYFQKQDDFLDEINLNPFIDPDQFYNDNNNFDFFQINAS